MTRDYEDLLQRELDAELSRTERAELLDAVAADPVLRTRREELLALADDLRTLGWQEPAPELADRIMDRIAEQPPYRARPDRPRPRIGLRPDGRQILAFAAGVVLMFGASRLVLPRVDGNDAAGTLITEPSAALSSGSFGAPGARAEAHLAREGDRLLLRARCEQETPTPVHVDWDRQIWSVSSVHSDPPADLAVDHGRARFIRDEPGSFTLEMEFQLRRPELASGDVRLRFADPAGGAEPLSLPTTREPPGR